MSARRLVVKIGSSLLVEGAGRLRREWLDSLAADLAACREQRHEVIVVTSGAIALGRAALGLKARVLRLEDKQAAAAVGQINLAHAYQASLAQHGLPTAQLLLTLDSRNGPLDEKVASAAFTRATGRSVDEPHPAGG